MKEERSPNCTSECEPDLDHDHHLHGSNRHQCQHHHHRFNVVESDRNCRNEKRKCAESSGVEETLKKVPGLKSREIFTISRDFLCVGKSGSYSVTPPHCINYGNFYSNCNNKRINPNNSHQFSYSPSEGWKIGGEGKREARWRLTDFFAKEPRHINSDKMSHQRYPSSPATVSALSISPPTSTTSTSMILPTTIEDIAEGSSLERTMKEVVLMRMGRSSCSMKILIMLEGCINAWRGPCSWALQYLIIYPLIIFAVWAVFYILFGQYALPGGSIFALTILVLLAIILGYVAERLQLPPLVGMLAAGLILRNVPYINFAKDLHPSFSSPLRGISVVILLTRGALSVNPKNIRKFAKVVPSLAIGCCVIEAISGSLAVYFILGFPLQWSFLMGCILSAMSGVAVMPYLVSVEKQQGTVLQQENNARAILIGKTACGLDAILAICMAEVALGFIFSDGDTEMGLMKGPLEILIGGSFGALWGGLAGILLDEKSCDDLRTITVFSGGVMSLMGLYKIGYPRGGPLGCFLGSFIASSFWRSRQVDGKNNDRLNLTFTKIWLIFQPLLFGIIGARTNLETVDWQIVSKGIACLAISLTIRLCAVFAMTSFTKLSFRERMFLVIAWIPKGTVQAALGPVALDTAIDLGVGKEFEDLAYKVMTISVATIIIASVLGGIILARVGPKILISPGQAYPK